MQTGNTRRTPDAAVAIIEIPSPEWQILVLRRAARPGDHWSGHYSFPGGRRDKNDPSLLDTAIRETEEETGVRLKKTQLVKALPAAPARRSKKVPVWVQPYHFQLTTMPKLQLNPQEIQDSYWVTISSFQQPGKHQWREMLPDRVPGQLYPAWPLGDYYLWGFTYELLAQICNHPLPQRDGA